MRISDWSSDVCSSDLLSVSFIDAATQAPQRIALADGATIDLKLPAGVETGTQMRLAGKGQPGPGGTGDGIVTITVKDHPFYEREGANIRLERSEEHTSALQELMRNWYAVFCLNKHTIKDRTYTSRLK